MFDKRAGGVIGLKAKGNRKGATMPDEQKADGHGLAVPYLRAWRNYRAYSQSELAKRAGVSRATISSAEGGARIWPAHVRELAQALGVTPADLQKRPPDGDVSVSSGA